MIKTRFTLFMKHASYRVVRIVCQWDLYIFFKNWFSKHTRRQRRRCRLNNTWYVKNPWGQTGRRKKKGDPFFLWMTQWDRAIVLKLTSDAPTCSILGRTSNLSCRCSRIFWLWDRPLLQSRRRRRQQMAGASFAPLHTSHVLLLLPRALSLSLVCSPCDSFSLSRSQS